LALAISLRQSQLSKVRRDTSHLILLESNLAAERRPGYFWVPCNTYFLFCIYKMTLTSTLEFIHSNV